MAESPWLGDAAWRQRIEGLRIAPPFGVGRRWLSGRFPDVASFLGTSAYGPLDNLSRVDAFESGAARWAARSGGTVVEAHGYALTDTSDATRDRLWAEAARLHPELGAAKVLAEEWLVEADCALVDTSPVEAPEGVNAMARTPFSRTTSASTVGLPRESKTSRPRIWTIFIGAAGGGLPSHLK